MRNALPSCLLAVLLSATSAFAQFEGVLTMTLSAVSKDGSGRSGGTINLAISKAGMRGEITMQLGPGVGMHSVVLCRTDTPNTNYLLSAANRTYTEIALSQPAEAESARQAQAQWTVKKRRPEKLLGYKTQHVLAQSKTGPPQSVELWVATNLLDLDTYRKLQSFSGGGMSGEGGLTQALKEAGVEGMPLKAVVTTESGGQVRLQVVKAEKKPLPASTFEIPAGYTKSAGGNAGKSR